MKIQVKSTFASFYFLLMTAAMCLLLYTSSMDKLRVFEDTGRVRTVVNVAYETSMGESGFLNLPTQLKDLPSRTSVTLITKFEIHPRESLLVKSVYAPMQVYLDGDLVFESGQEGRYPSFMNDPPTILSIIPLPDEGGMVTLRVVYLSPSQRSTLSLPQLFIGEGAGLITRQFYSDGFSFLFSVLLLFIGFLMIIVSISLAVRLSSGLSLFFLGLFSLLAGMWGLGECDLTAFLLPRPSFLHVITYIGLFTMTIPFLHFSLIMLQPKNRLVLQICLWVHYISFTVVLFLQLCKVMDFTKTLYWFHILMPVMFAVFTLFLLREHFRYRNTAAKRFGMAILLPGTALLLEVANHWLHFTGMITLFFQLGLLAFVLVFGVVSGYYIRQSLREAAEKKRLEYEMAVVNHQLELQRIQYRKMADQAEAIKAQHHDLRHQLTVLRELSTAGELEKLESYIDALVEKIPSGKGSLFCENYAVNAVTDYYFTRAKQEGVDISVQLAVPPVLSSTQEIDLCIIVGNLLENATEACSRMAEGTKFIRLSSRFQYGVLTITVDNSFRHGSTRCRGGVFLSSKRDGEGTGLSSVQATTEKYGGAASFEARDGVFFSSVYIHLPEEDIKPSH